ncbi:MAG: hypothetical protein K8J08_00140 [Thermoanaerobaculia bacterium]|nr:hypothetical protein [Thermoanaerobaculia bacterium]
MPHRQQVLAVLLVAAINTIGCASLPASHLDSSPRVVVLTPLDGVPIRARDALPGEPISGDFEAARGAALSLLRDDFEALLLEGGVDVVEGDLPALTGRRPDFSEIAGLGQQADADAVLFTELVAYGNIRRSWLWILAGQALAAGVGHGVVVASATGSSAYGWWAGAGEFALETATWVGGATVGSRGIDPVLLRVWLVDAEDESVLGRWTREGTRPVRHWFRRRGMPARDVRLRQVADAVLEKLTPRVLRRLSKKRPGHLDASPPR